LRFFVLFPIWGARLDGRLDMAKTETIRARVEPELKQEAEAVLKALGLNASEAITIFYRQVALRRALPFEVKLPNATTRAAMRQALEGEDLTEWADLEELKATHG
jgi:DNA-damage-inducible protein J